MPHFTSKYHKRNPSKEKHYAKVIKESNAIFYPLVVETHGGFGHKFSKFLKLPKDATYHHQLSDTESESWFRNARCAIAVALQVGNATMSTRSMRYASMKKRRIQANERPAQDVDVSLFVDLEVAQSHELAVAV